MRKAKKIVKLNDDGVEVKKFRVEARLVHDISLVVEAPCEEAALAAFDVLYRDGKIGVGNGVVNDVLDESLEDLDAEEV